MAEIVPKRADTFEKQYPVPEQGLSPEQIWEARVRAAKEEFGQFPYRAEDEISERLRPELDKVQLTLHAHSQGALLAAVASGRLGSVPRRRSHSVREMWGGGVNPGLFFPVPVAPQFKYLSYGGAANMLDYGPDKQFASYTHHFNKRDGVTMLVGMMDPFQHGALVNGAAFFLRGLQKENYLSGNLVRRVALWAHPSELVEAVFEPNAHLWRIKNGPTFEERFAWSKFHKVIYHSYHSADVSAPNIEHHNFDNAYVCNVGTEDWIPLTVWPEINETRKKQVFGINPQEGIGAMDCLRDKKESP